MEKLPFEMALKRYSSFYRQRWRGNVSRQKEQLGSDVPFAESKTAWVGTMVVRSMMYYVLEEWGSLLLEGYLALSWMLSRGFSEGLYLSLVTPQSCVIWGEEEKQKLLETKKHITQLLHEGTCRRSRCNRNYFNQWRSQVWTPYHISSHRMAVTMMDLGRFVSI